jgi:hypothetical protein
MKGNAMAKTSLNLVSPDGTRIVATLERLSGRAMLEPGSARRKQEGGLEFDYEGTTEILGDEQKTIVRNGQRIFLDEEGGEYPENELRLAPEGIDEPALEPEAVITVTLEGGVIQGIEGVPPGVTIRVLDHDVEGVEPERLRPLADGERALVSEWRSQPEAVS